MDDRAPALPEVQRRRLLLALAAGGSLAACGGGSSDGGSAVSGTPEAPGGGPTVPVVAGAFEPPATGAFGGGQGQVLFVEGGDYPQTVKRFDLGTRRVETLAKPRSAGFFALRTGVVRASDGSFVVIGDDSTKVGSSRTIFHYRADGSLIRTRDTSLVVTRGLALSPDGGSVAFAQKVMVNIGDRFPTWRDALRVSVMDLASGVERSGELLGTADPPLDKSVYNPRVTWAGDGSLWVLSELGLHRIDPATAVPTRVQSTVVDDPVTLTASADGRHLFFEQRRGNPYGPTVWSLDVGSGALRQRSRRSASGHQYAPGLSPDGRWLLMQQARLTLAGTAVLSAHEISAVALTDDPVDTQSLALVLRDAAGNPVLASGAMAWY